MVSTAQDTHSNILYNPLVLCSAVAECSMFELSDCGLDTKLHTLSFYDLFWIECQKGCAGDHTVWSFCVIARQQCFRAGVLQLNTLLCLASVGTFSWLALISLASPFWHFAFSERHRAVRPFTLRCTAVSVLLITPCFFSALRSRMHTVYLTSNE